jgi:co-chaperonin GroES (HSP10)
MNLAGDFLVVKKLAPSNIAMSRQYIDQFQRCVVVAPRPDSILSPGDEILVTDNIFFGDASEIEKDSFFIYEEEVFGVVSDGVIKPMNNIVYVETDKAKKNQIGNIVVDTRYQTGKAENRVQDGTVLSVCEKAVDSYFLKELDIEIAPGDKVYTHHFLTSEDSEREFNGKKYYEIRYEDIYCKVVDSEIEMLNDWNFVTPIVKEAEVTESGIVLDSGKRVEAVTAIMQHPNKVTETYPGDKILFRKGREYNIDVEGHRYYRIPNDSIYYNLDKMKPLGNIIAVEPMRKELEVGNIVVGTKKEELPEKGRVFAVSENIEGKVNEGDVVLFRKAASTHVTIEGKELMLMDIKNVYSVI